MPNISKEMLQKALSEVVPDTYNMVSVDGDTSTNDTVLLLANGLAGNPEITEENEDYKIFKEALFEVNKNTGDAHRRRRRGRNRTVRSDDSGSREQRAGRDTGEIRHHIESDESGNLRP